MNHLIAWSAIERRKFRAENGPVASTAICRSGLLLLDYPLYAVKRLAIESGVPLAVPAAVGFRIACEGAWRFDRFTARDDATDVSIVQVVLTEPPITIVHKRLATIV